MKLPQVIKFQDLDIPSSELRPESTGGPMPENWTRVEFKLPDKGKSETITEWLRDNIAGNWTHYVYQEAQGVHPLVAMTVRFQDKNDAMMFKLRGGHQCWMES
jgi:hypothetical protein